MTRDVDIIIAAVKRAVPSVTVIQMHKTFPADDDGLWWFRLPGIAKDIQIESSEGACPFVIESDDFSCSDAKLGKTKDEVITIVVDYLRSLLPPQS